MICDQNFWLQYLKYILLNFQSSVAKPASRLLQGQPSSQVVTGIATSKIVQQAGSLIVATAAGTSGIQTVVSVLTFWSFEALTCAPTRLIARSNVVSPPAK